MKALRQKYPAAFGAAIGILVASSAALAAWIIYTGATGTGGGKVGTSSTVGALTLTADCNTADGANCTPVAPGQNGNVYGTVQGNSADTGTHQITSLTAQSITANPTCNTAGLSFTIDPSLSSRSFGFVNGSAPPDVLLGELTASSNLDPNCTGASLTINLTGTTSP